MSSPKLTTQLLQVLEILLLCHVGGEAPIRRDLIRQTGLGPTCLDTQLRQLRDNGWVAWLASKHDPRSKNYWLSEHGEAATRELMAKYRPWLLEYLALTAKQPPWHHPVHNRLADLAQPMPGEILLDVGCGSGATLAAVAARMHDVRLIGVDLHAARLAEALGRVGSNSVVMVRADLAGSLPLRDGSVDVVVCHNVVELLPDPLSLFVNLARVLRSGGRAVLSHTDFASLIVHGADPQLTARIVGAYAQVAQPWMNHIDPHAARRLPGLVAGSGLVLDRIDGHVLADHRVAGAGWHRLVEIAAAVRGHVRRGLIDLDDSDVDDWWEQLAHADARGEFCFAETALITLAHRSG